MAAFTEIQAAILIDEMEYHKVYMTMILPKKK
jgi:hypothetical protein